MPSNDNQESNETLFSQRKEYPILCSYLWLLFLSSTIFILSLPPLRLLIYVYPESILFQDSPTLIQTAAVTHLFIAAVLLCLVSLLLILPSCVCSLKQGKSRGLYKAENLSMIPHLSLNLNQSPYCNLQVPC